MMRSPLFETPPSNGGSSVPHSAPALLVTSLAESALLRQQLNNERARHEDTQLKNFTQNASAVIYGSPNSSFV